MDFAEGACGRLRCLLTRAGGYTASGLPPGAHGGAEVGETTPRDPDVAALQAQVKAIDKKLDDTRGELRDLKGSLEDRIDAFIQAVQQETRARQDADDKERGEREDGDHNLSSRLWSAFIGALTLVGAMFAAAFYSRHA